MFSKYLEPPVNLKLGPVVSHPSQNPPPPIYKDPPKLDFLKFNGENPKIWHRKCEVYFDVFGVPEGLRTCFITLNFVERAALWLETIETQHRIEDWDHLSVSVC